MVTLSAIQIFLMYLQQMTEHDLSLTKITV